MTMTTRPRRPGSVPTDGDRAPVDVPAFLRAAPQLEISEDTRSAASQGFALLCKRCQRMADANLLGGRDPVVAASQFNALCEGLATDEHRNPNYLGPDPKFAWRNALTTLTNGFRIPLQTR